MSKSIADVPAMDVPEDVLWSGRLPLLEAQCASELGPLLKRVIMSGPYAGSETVLMVGPEANRFVLHTHRDHFSHDQGWSPIIGDLMGKGLLNMDGPEHDRHRKMWNPAFTNAYMEGYLPVMELVIAEHSARWAAQDTVDVYLGAREITFGIAAAALSGVRSEADITRMRQLFYILLFGADPEIEEDYESYLAQMLAARAELSGLLLGIIADRRAMAGTEPARDVLGLIVRAQDEDGQTLSDEQVLAHLNILLVAGHETTTSLAAWVLYLLATLPEQRARVEAELTSLLGDSTAPITVEAVRGMKQLDYFIREAGRLYPPVLHVPRGVVQDVEFGGYTIPAGTQVRLALAASHHLPQVFADPERFDPDRFAPPREEDKRIPYSLVTFGGGSRVCIGINFANIEVKALAAHMLRHYTFTPVAGQQPVQMGFFTTVIPGGLWMRVRPRA